MDLAESLYGNENISGYCVDGHCIDYLSPCDNELGYNVLYEQNVSFNSSSIHIPRDIYVQGTIKIVTQTSATLYLPHVAMLIVRSASSRVHRVESWFG